MVIKVFDIETARRMLNVQSLEDILEEACVEPEDALLVLLNSGDVEVPLYLINELVESEENE